jgi:predicted tellurium resistance membrane protein TerC
VPLALRIAAMFAKDKKRLRQAAALCGIAGSLLLRYGWVRAGTISARDWRIPLRID